MRCCRACRRQPKESRFISMYGCGCENKDCQYPVIWWASTREKVLELWDEGNKKKEKK